jgi:hypothetical protein
MCTSVLPVFDKVTDKGDVQLNVLQLVAEMSACQPPEETASVCSPPVYDLLMVYCPPAPEVKDNKTEEPNLQFSFVECLLFAFHQLCKVVSHHKYIYFHSKVLDVRFIAIICDWLSHITQNDLFTHI